MNIWVIFMQYNLEYHKQLDRSHILQNVMKGAYTGIASQFISDIILSLLLFNNEIIVKYIQISHISHYFASVLTGMLAGLLIIYIDQSALVAVTTIFYNYSNTLGEMAQTSRLYLALCIFAWCWLFAGQFLLIELIWEYK